MRPVQVAVKIIGVQIQTMNSALVMACINGHQRNEVLETRAHL